MDKKTIFIFIFLFSFTYNINALEIGNVGVNGVNFKYITPLNYSLVNVNNSLFFAGQPQSYYCVNSTLSQYYLGSNPNNYLNSTSIPIDTWSRNYTYYYNKTEIDSLIPTTLTYYFWDVNSSVNSTYKIMNTTLNPVVTNHSISGLVDGSVIVYRLNENTNLSVLSGGSLHLHTSATKTGGTKDLQIRGKLAKVYLNGTVVDLLTTDTSPVLVNNVLTNLNLFSSISTPINLNVTDRLLWRLESVVTGSGTNPSVVISVGGSLQNGLDLPISLSDYTIIETDPKYGSNPSGYFNSSNYLSYNSTYNAKADYQFTNNNFNGSANFITSGKIGLNVLNPIDNLEVSTTNDGSNIMLWNPAASTGDFAGIRFKVAGVAGDTYKKGAIFFQRRSSYSDNIMHIAMDGTADTSNADLSDSVMNITTKGDVWIKGNLTAKNLIVSGCIKYNGGQLGTCA